MAYPRSKPRWRWLCRVQNPCGDKRSRCVSPDMDRGSRVRCDGGVLSVECEPSCCPAVGASPTVTSSTCSTGRRESADVSTQDESDVSSRVLLRQSSRMRHVRSDTCGRSADHKAAASAIFTICLPKFSPENRRSIAFGAFSRPYATSSLYTRLPSRCHRFSVSRASGSRVG